MASWFYSNHSRVCSALASSAIVPALLYHLDFVWKNMFLTSPKAPTFGFTRICPIFVLSRSTSCTPLKGVPRSMQSYIPVGEKKEGKNPLFKYIKCDINVLSIEDAYGLCVSRPFYVLLHVHHE